MTQTGKRKTALSEAADEIRSPKKRFAEGGSQGQTVETGEDEGDRDEQAGEPEASSSSEPVENNDEGPASSKSQDRMDRFKALQARAVGPTSPYSLFFKIY